MGQDQGPYGDQDGFTPYQPDATPDAEPTAPAAPLDPHPPTPYVPYGGATQDPNAPSVPYGGANLASFNTPYATTSATSSGRWLGWLIGGVVTLVTCGGGGIAVLADILDGSDTPTTAPDITIPSFSDFSIDIPEIEIPEIDIPTPVFANDLKRDQCLIGAGFDPGSNAGLSNLEITSCDGAHNAQVLEVRVLSERDARDYDFTDGDQGNKSCFPLFSPAQKELFRGDKYTLLSFTEMVAPKKGDKVACLVVRTDGKLYRGFLPKG